MRNFFISYNGADREWARWIAWELEALGYTTFLQDWDFRPGSNFVLEMQKASSDSQQTIAILSPNYLDAKYTHAEWAAALTEDPTGQERKLIPVRVGECKLRGLWSALVYIDLVGLDEAAARNTLVEGVRSDRVKPSKPPCFPGMGDEAANQPRFPGKSGRRFLLRYVLVPGVLALSLGGWFGAKRYLQHSSQASTQSGMNSGRVNSGPEHAGPFGSDPASKLRSTAGYILVPAGQFVMGCTSSQLPCYEDELSHQVYLPEFRLKATEVTVAEFRSYVQDIGGKEPGVDVPPDTPVTNVTWEQASRYCDWSGGRLPTEAEWEYAARGGTTGPFYDKLDEIAWHQGNTPSESPQPVARKMRNKFGLYDMLGNVAEWVADWYDPDYYRVSPSKTPGGPDLGTERVIRGGSYLDNANTVRVSRRDRKPPDSKASNVGFRCAQ